MAAVAAEPGAAAASTTAGDRIEFETEPGEHAAQLDADSTQDCAPALDLCHQTGDMDAVQECSPVQTEVRRPDRAVAGKALAGHAEDGHAATDCAWGPDNSSGDYILMDYKLKDFLAKGECLKEQFSSNVEAANEVSPHDPSACLLPRSISDSQPSVVYLHSLPAHPLETDSGLSLAEVAEPAVEFYHDPESTHPTDSACKFIGFAKPSHDTDQEPELSFDAPVSEFESPEDAFRESPQPSDHPQSLSVLEDTSSGESEEKVYSTGSPSMPTTDSSELPAVLDQPVISTEPEHMHSHQKELSEQDRIELETELKPPVHCVEPRETEPESVSHLTPGSEVRVSLDHIIDDALVVSFRLGEKIFSGVLMDLSKRFGPYGIPITVFPKREYKDKPESMQLKMEPFQPTTGEKGGSQEAPDAPPKEPPQGPMVPEPNPEPKPNPWTSKPPPLFQEGAPYPPPLFIRDSYNQSLPQPLPRKIKRPKRRLYREEPTSIMNAIKLRPRQVLCDKCKGAVVSDKRETRRGPVSDCRSDDAKRRRSDSTVATNTNKRVRNEARSEERGRAGDGPKRHSAAIRVSSLGPVKGAASGNRVVRGVSAAAPSSGSGGSRVQLNAKKVLQSKNVDHVKAREVLARAQRRQGETDGAGSVRPKAVTRAAALQEAHQKIHFTRRLQQMSGAGSGLSNPLPPRMRIKPQSRATLKGC